ncbi:chitin synthase chs-2-like isoform X3 [Dermacentor albipictus]|uniref:chitin synthase chs-2-like isoform X3 n=1 Tax=Dermacentor albipictus TaxID=60249 RepID=UPI0038FCE82E
MTAPEGTGRPGTIMQLFKESPPEDTDETVTSFATAIFLKGSKVLAYVITFAVVLCGSVISKATLLVMTSQIQGLGSGRGLNRTRTVCNREVFLDDDGEYVTGIDRMEQIAWMWAILFAMFIPEALVFIRSVRISMFQPMRIPHARTFFLVFALQSLHVVGLGFLVFAALPELDALRATMVCSSAAFVPALLKALSQKDTSPPAVVLNVSTLLAQCSGLVLWSVGAGGTPILAVALLLSSCAWWQCFADENSPVFRLARLRSLKRDLDKCSVFVSLVLVPWRMLLTFATMLALAGSSLDGAADVIGKFHESFQAHEFPLLRARTDVDSGLQLEELVGTNYVIWTPRLVPVAVGAVHAAASYVTYRACVFACRIKIQGFSMALPLTLSGPVTMLVLAATCAQRRLQPCLLSGVLPSYVFLNCYGGTFMQLFAEEHAWVWIAWLLSLGCVTAHVWKSKGQRMASEESLFAQPTYASALLEQSVTLNIRRLSRHEMDHTDRREQLQASMESFREAVETRLRTLKHSKHQLEDEDDVTRIYACATMWHETKEEMLQLLKSVLRMDCDQSARRLSRLHLGLKDKLYYVFETHIIFDDAFKDVQDASGRKCRVINDYVQTLISTVNEAACSVYGLNDVCLRPPRVLDTPYGGRLVWTMPGRNGLVVHLKDRSRIRNKKRWSQVMYMYYLLGHQLAESNLEPHRKEVRKQNTYILALDGDISFRPEAVLYLLDHMKNNAGLGAACGRIHPIGSGPMVWYQEFEYAVGHWLQKATEHVLGCVLCSPGCFSLFRSEALMADNVLKTYTTKSTEALHFVQYDQGEDRWLCTLLLKQGYQVEYSAASDAYTRCPETFEEFYTQRRRWTPSTMANIIDILMSARRMARNNSGISNFYMAYQGMLLVGTILGPGTIFLMLVGAFVNCFKMSIMSAFGFNAVPVLCFVAVCFLCSQQIQIAVAQLLSVAYALLMAAVIVGTALQIQEDGISSPASIFIVGTALVFFLAALVHPQEFRCLMHGLLYFVLVPSMYLILALYSVINLNVVSWGTRETSAANTTQGGADHAPSNADRYRPMAQAMMTCRLGDILTCLWCTKSHGGTTWGDFSLNTVSRGDSRPESLEPLLKECANKMPVLNEEEEGEDNSGQHKELKPNGALPGPQGAAAECDHSAWHTHPTLRHCTRDDLEPEEDRFWNSLITEFLEPEKAKDASTVHEMQEKLDALRNRVVSALLFCNAMYVLVIVLLQHHRSTLYIEWPLAANVTIGYVPSAEFVVVQSNYKRLEPLGMVFIAFFAFILLLQVSGMIIHRFHTFSHMLASISILDSTEPSEGYKTYLSALKELQTPETIEDLPPANASASGEETWRRPRAVDLEFVLTRNLMNMNNRHEIELIPETNTSCLKQALSRQAVADMLRRRGSDPSLSRRSRRKPLRSASSYR